MADMMTERLAPLLLWRAVKHVQACSVVTMTDDEAMRAMGVPADIAEALARVKALESEVMALRMERERLRGVVEHARGALIGLAQMECDDRDENKDGEDDAWSDGYDDAVDKVETRAWAAVEWIDAALSGEPQS